MYGGNIPPFSRQQRNKPLCRDGFDFNHLLPRCLPAFQADLLPGNCQPLCQKAQQGFVCLAVHRRRGEANFQCLAMQPGTFTFFAPG